MLALGKASGGGGKNKASRIEEACTAYLSIASKLQLKIDNLIFQLTLANTQSALLLSSLEFFKQMLDKHIDLVHRRLILKETIPHQEKLFSIFEQYTEWITKGKKRPNVELGKKVLITTDQYHLIMDHQADSEAVV